MVGGSKAYVGNAMGKKETAVEIKLNCLI